MNRLLLASLCVLLPSCVIVIGEDHFGRRGSGNRIQEQRETPHFHAIEFRGAGDIQIQVGQEKSVLLSGDDDLLGEVTTEVQSGVLLIDYPDGFRFREGLEITIALPSLQAVEVLGAADVRIRDMRGPKLRLSISGSGNIQADGSADNLDLSISGSGELKLRNLATMTASVHISGSGDAELNVSKDLRYRISGSGDIDYIGNAHAVGSISGSGSIDRSN